jgi:hypothetical protein
MLMLWLLNRQNFLVVRPDFCVEAAVEATTATADALRRLLHWLMGAPAGLKLHTTFSQVRGAAGRLQTQCRAGLAFTVCKESDQAC